ncbi:MAG: hypothetical protein JWM33_969 [Caulobacteraceae bacterium]|nr:hypothetical protein [Caulobacteraceae bacterium]
MRRIGVLAVVIAAVPALAAAQMLTVPKEAPQPTVGGCVWAAKPEVLRAYLLLMENSSAKVPQQRSDFFKAHQAELLAQATVCEKSAKVSDTVSMIAITAEASMREAQGMVSFETPTRQKLNKIWADVTEETRQCVRATAYKSLGVTPPACANPKSVDNLFQAFTGQSRSDTVRSASLAMFAPRIDAYYNALALSELAEAQIARAMTPAP